MSSAGHTPFKLLRSSYVVVGRFLSSHLLLCLFWCLLYPEGGKPL